MAKLTEKGIASLKKGTVADGGGLYLEVRPNGNKRFIFRWTVPPRGKEKRGTPARLALGPFKKASEVGVGYSLVQARHKVAELQQLIFEGGDPRQVKKIEELIDFTFGEAAEKYLEAHMLSLIHI